MTTTVYTLKDFEDIIWSTNNRPEEDAKNSFQLPQEIIDLITSLTEKVGAPNYIKTPAFIKGGGNGRDGEKHNNYKKKRRPDQPTTNADDWEAVRNFKKTEIAKKEGVEKDIDNIRLLINKLTDKTYDKIIEKLLETIDEITEKFNIVDSASDSSGVSILSDEDIINHLNKIGYAIFNMATSNKFNSGVYAKLTCELKNKYEFMRPIINNNIDEFMKMFENMEFVSSTEDYNRFCEINIINDKRRAMSLFMVNLYKNAVISLDSMFENINNIQNMIVNEESITNIDKISEIDELSENLYVILTNIPMKLFQKHGSWLQIYDNLVRISKIDTKINKGISSKSKFKHMDILDKLKGK
jgi:hypothetical protein|tara:strand:- start:704 stop:1768 length:1065 start_codon:yes stop_codon:yes gene_type:complete